VVVQGIDMFLGPELLAEDAVPEPLIENVPDPECSNESVEAFRVYRPTQAESVTVSVELVACEY
jgi:hypothetical protein